MCGIVEYIGSEDATSILLAGLRELEYRGYDSAGVAMLESSGIQCFKNDVDMPRNLAKSVAVE
jgi:glucosamine--fructose-6-phosphate aminotransferase (isomerizing)